MGGAKSGFSLVETTVALAVLLTMAVGLGSAAATIARSDRGLRERRWMLDRALSSLAELAAAELGGGRLAWGDPPEAWSELWILRHGDGRWRAVREVPDEPTIRLVRRVEFRPVALDQGELLESWPTRRPSTAEEVHGLEIKVTVTSRAPVVAAGRRSIRLLALRFD